MMSDEGMAFLLAWALLVVSPGAVLWVSFECLEWFRRRAVDRKYKARFEALEAEQADWDAFVKRELADLNRPTRTITEGMKMGPRLRGDDDAEKWHANG